MRLVRYLLLIVVLSLPAFANQAVMGFCQQGNQQVTTSGIKSSTKVQASFPSCTITVYVHGSLTLATLYSDNNASPTPLANPFTANANSTWTFYTGNSRVDVVQSGGGMPSPLTISDVLVNDPTASSIYLVDTLAEVSADICVATNTALSQLSSAKATLQYSAQSYANCTTPITLTGHSDLRLSGPAYASARINSGLTGNPAASLITGTNMDRVEFDNLELSGNGGTATTGHLVSMINTATSHGNLLFHRVYLANTLGNGQDRTGASIGAAAIYCAGCETVLIDGESTLTNNKYDLYLDNTGPGGPNVQVNIDSSNIQGATVAAIYCTATTNCQLINIHKSNLSENTGPAIQTAPGASIFNLNLRDNLIEYNAGGAVVIGTGGAVFGGVISGNTFVAHGTQTADFFSLGAAVEGVVIHGNDFSVDSSPIGMDALATGVFTDTSFEGNSISLAAGGTLPNIVHSLAGTKAYGMKIRQPYNTTLFGAGATITNCLTDDQLGVTIAWDSTNKCGQLLYNGSYSVTGSGNGLAQTTTNPLVLSSPLSAEVDIYGNATTAWLGLNTSSGTPLMRLQGGVSGGKHTFDIIDPATSYGVFDYGTANLNINAPPGGGGALVCVNANGCTGGLAVYNGAASPALVAQITNTGVLNSGLGLKHIRTATTCSTAASIGATCTTAAITWPGTAFPDTNYTMTCTIAGVSTGVPTIVSISPSTGTFTVTIGALTAAAASPAVIHCIAMHD